MVSVSCDNAENAKRIAKWKEPKYPGAEGIRVDNVALDITNSTIIGVDSSPKVTAAKKNTPASKIQINKVRKTNFDKIL